MPIAKKYEKNIKELTKITKLSITTKNILRHFSVKGVRILCIFL